MKIFNLLKKYSQVIRLGKKKSLLYQQYLGKYVIEVYHLCRSNKNIKHLRLGHLGGTVG